ncbi:hypothetical protein CTZ27_09230 [Streptomyces griseocarneus]|nr:hypothetical protein CTZ27_09230 [Streptomyces griseocarneus]
MTPLPIWYFAFESVASGAYDLYKAFPGQALWVLIPLAAVNLVVSLTVLRSRLKLAKRLWHGKKTRKIALGLLALRLGSHFVLALAGAAVDTMAGHLAFAAVMAATSGVLLWWAQRTALRALAAEDARLAPATPEV